MTFSKFEIYFQVISNCHLKMGINFFGTPCICLCLRCRIQSHFSPRIVVHVNFILWDTDTDVCYPQIKRHSGVNRHFIYATGLRRQVLWASRRHSWFTCWFLKHCKTARNCSIKLKYQLLHIIVAAIQIEMIYCPASLTLTTRQASADDRSTI